MPNYVTELKTNDVLFGRGSGPNDHEGNVRFREYVAERKVAYMATNHRMTKAKIAKEIVDLVFASNGRFLKKVEDAKLLERLGLSEGADCYEIVDDDNIMEKAKQALRQNAAKVRGEVEAAKKQIDNTTGKQNEKTTTTPKQTGRKNNDSVGYEEDFEPIPYSSTPFTVNPAAVASTTTARSTHQQQQITEQQQQAWASNVVPSVAVSSDDSLSQQSRLSNISRPYQNDNINDYRAMPPPSNIPQGLHRNTLSAPATAFDTVQTSRPSSVYPSNIQGFGHQPIQRPSQLQQGLHRPTVSAPVIPHEASNFSMAELPNEEVTFARPRPVDLDSRRTSLTVNDLMKEHSLNRNQAVNNNPNSRLYQRRQSPDMSMEDLMDSFNQMKTGTGSGPDFEQRRMMASTETMGTIEQIGSVADMSFNTMGSSTFSLFGRGNDSMAVPEDKQVTYDGTDALSSASVTHSSPSGATGGTSRGGSRNSFESNITLDSLGDSSKFRSSGSSMPQRSSINSIISGVRRQVESEFPSTSTLPRTVGVMEEEPDDLLMNRMGDSSISVLKSAFNSEDIIDPESATSFTHRNQGNRQHQRREEI